MRKIIDVIVLYFMVDLMRGSFARIYLAIMCLINLGVCYVIIHQNNTIQTQRVELKKAASAYTNCINNSK